MIFDRPLAGFSAAQFDDPTHFSDDIPTILNVDKGLTLYLYRFLRMTFGLERR